MVTHPRPALPPSTRSGGGTARERVRHGASSARAIRGQWSWGWGGWGWPGRAQHCPLGPSVILHPAVLRDERIYHFLHGEVGDELVLGQGTPRHRIEMTHALQGRRQPRTGYSTRPASAPGHRQVATRPAPRRHSSQASMCLPGWEKSGAEGQCPPRRCQPAG